MAKIKTNSGAKKGLLLPEQEMIKRKMCISHIFKKSKNKKEDCHILCLLIKRQKYKTFIGVKINRCCSYLVNRMYVQRFPCMETLTFKTHNIMPRSVNHVAHAIAERKY